MKLLIVTQKVDQNDPILGFFYKWIIEFSKKFESVVVICLEKGIVKNQNDSGADLGRHDRLPNNVRVLSLGKEEHPSRLKYIYRFYKYIWQERKNYDVVFVHMNPIYIILGWVFWKFLGKKITLWYTHKHVDFKLRLAEKMVDRIFTASTESFRLESRKVVVVGHGIDTDLFFPQNNATTDGHVYTLISVGRISEAKNQHLMVEVVKILRNKGFVCRIIFVGDAVTQADLLYKDKIKSQILACKINDPQIVYFAGSVSPQKIIDWYRSADLFINLSSTGSLDKAVLEAMSSGLQVITSNEAFKNILPVENLTNNRPEDVAQKIINISSKAPNLQMREIVVKNHNLGRLVDRLESLMRKL